MTVPSPEVLDAGVPGSEYVIDADTLRAVPLDRAAMSRAALALPDDQASLAGMLHAMAGDLARAEERLHFALARSGGDAARVVAEIRLAQVDQLAGRPEAALARLDTATATCREQPGLAHLLDFALQHRGKLFFETGLHDRALESLHEALALREAKGDPVLAASTRQAIATVERHRSAG